MAQPNTSPADYIAPLDMNGLSGRMLHVPAPAGKKTEFLFIYGQHSSLERWWGLIQYIGRYGAVTAVDLPGLGGMDSFYTIGKKPTLDNFADYLAAFIKMRYKNKRVVVVGMSLGFAIVTRMLQRYPELKKNVSMLVSLVGLVHGDDFKIPPMLYFFFRSLATVMKFRVPALFFRYVCLNSWTLRTAYHRTPNAKHKFAAAKNAAEHEQFILLVGLATVIVNGVLLIFGPDARPINLPYSFDSYAVGPLFIDKVRVLAAVAALAVAAALFLFFRYTRTGTAIRACADNLTGAAVVGLNVKQLYAVTFGLGLACVGAAGSLMATIADASPGLAQAYTLLAFTIVIIGGLGSMVGALVGGVLIGVSEALAGFYIQPSMKSMFSFALLIIVLVLRPQGLMGRRL